MILKTKKNIHTIFLRFDILDGPTIPGSDQKSSMNLTVFTSDELPINIVNTKDAEDFYTGAMGTDLMAVPLGNPATTNSNITYSCHNDIRQFV
jgi:hypothetical protein